MKTAQEKQQVGGVLGFIERVGNKIPDIKTDTFLKMHW